MIPQVSRRNFLKTSVTCATLAPLVSLSFERPPQKYHKITQDWCIWTPSITNWNDFNVYGLIGLSKILPYKPYGSYPSEYVLRGDNYIYVNDDKYYKITNFHGEFVKGTNNNLYETKFDIIKYLGKTPDERIIIVNNTDFCYAIGKDHYKECEGTFGKGWTLDRQDIYRPITKEMHSTIKYFHFNRKSYETYLESYNQYVKTT